ncbi:MAG: hypothetical protein HZA51_16180 [Planctomycetes bacterium]|nr:hypothetical protein [Planctomycetota bacterium]
MILLTVGTQYFDELIDEADKLAAEGVFPEPVFAQIGLSKTKPHHLQHFAFDANLLDHAANASLIITHAGTGSLCELIALGRPFIAVVNDTKAGNHQLEFLQHLSTLYDFCWIDSPRKLRDALHHARPAKPLGSPGVTRLATDIADYLAAVPAQHV